MTETSSYLIKDYTELYKAVMQFNQNKTAFIHQWYPFVEGYSKEFIKSIIGELDYTPECALDPFAGSGTTPVELQDLDIKCYSFEVSPFMHLLATVKLETNYELDYFNNAIISVALNLKNCPSNIRELIKPPLAKTFQQNEKLTKWVFHETVMNAVLEIKYAINKVSDKKYKSLFKIALGSILLEISNVYRNGKCVSYKKNWRQELLTRDDVHKLFFDKLTSVIQPDIEKIEENEYCIENKYLCLYGDVLKNIDVIPDASIDLVITSPPYLNSRDYTDTYIVELWMLDLIKDYEALKALRSNTFKSHVQITYGQTETLNIAELKSCLAKLEIQKDLWNKDIPAMIKGYFNDMHTLFYKLNKKMQRGKKVYFNVANSAYHGVEIKVDEIVAAIAETHGFIINEIREARQLKPSSQQKDTIKSLRESVIVMTSSF